MRFEFWLRKLQKTIRSIWRLQTLGLLSAGVLFQPLGIVAQQDTNPKPSQLKQGKQSTVTHPAQQPLKNNGSSGQERPAIVITLRASREQPSPGSDFGISADVENISDKAVYLHSQGFTMIAPPELDSEGPQDWFAWLPGPYAGIDDDIHDTTPREYKKVVVIAPHSKLSAFWSGNTQPRNKKPWRHGEWICTLLGEDCDTLLRNINFPPGKYTINVVGSYWESAVDAKSKATQRRTQIASIELPIVAPQATIIFGAALGGLFAYLIVVLPTRTGSLGPLRVLRVVGELITSVLLAVIVTILLARLSESQFLIKVSINDFWGAITIGFIATAAGPTVLRKISSALGSPPPAQESDPGTKTPPKGDGVHTAEPQSPANSQ